MIPITIDMNTAETLNSSPSLNPHLKHWLSNERGLDKACLQGGRGTSQNGSKKFEIARTTLCVLSSSVLMVSL